MSHPDLDDVHVSGPVITLAARVIKALESAGFSEKTSYGTFYVRRVEIAWSDGYDAETCLYLTPNEADGETFDAWTPNRGTVEVDQ